MDKFVEEMGKLFPDQYFHIGGDEVDGKYWDSNPKIQAFKQAHGMKTNADLQAYYNEHLEKILTKHHKIMVRPRHSTRGRSQHAERSDCGVPSRS